MKLKPYQLRVCNELQELRDRLQKLSEFQTTTNYTRLPLDDRNLLTTQADIMRAYVSVLQARMDRWQQKENQ